MNFSLQHYQIHCMSFCDFYLVFRTITTCSQCEFCGNSVRKNNDIYTQPLREPTIFLVYAVDYSAIFQIWISISGNLVSRPPDFATKKPKLLTYFHTSQKVLSFMSFFALHICHICIVKSIFGWKWQFWLVYTYWSLILLSSLSLLELSTLP